MTIEQLTQFISSDSMDHYNQSSIEFLVFRLFSHPIVSATVSKFISMLPNEQVTIVFLKVFHFGLVVTD